MKRVLVYLTEEQLAPKGGPYAVGYYIKQQLDQRGITNFHFISQPTAESKQVSRSVSNNVLIDKVKYWRHIWKRYRRYSNALKNGGYARVDLNQYDIVHFHHTREMFEARKSLETYQGTILLTSHSPVPLSKEIYDEQITDFEKKFFSNIYNRLIEMDEYAFRRADYIVFPCEDAEEPYLNNWDNYREIKETRHDQYRYVPTGIPDCSAKRDRAAVREELSIPQDAFMMSYIGRHNYVKGYDKLKEIGARMLDQNTWMVVAGKEYPLTRLQNDHWLEVGWTNDAHSYISASDVFVLPNLETYFDIVMLEVLALGKIVVASRTGGNRYFKKLQGSDGIFLYDNIEEACDILNRIRCFSKEEREKLGSQNRELYQKYFTDKVFVDGYLRLLDTL